MTLGYAYLMSTYITFPKHLELYWGNNKSVFSKVSKDEQMKQVYAAEVSYNAL